MTQTTYRLRAHSSTGKPVVFCPTDRIKKQFFTETNDGKQITNVQITVDEESNLPNYTLFKQFIDATMQDFIGRGFVPESIAFLVLHEGTSWTSKAGRPAIQFKVPADIAMGNDYEYSPTVV